MNKILGKITEGPLAGREVELASQDEVVLLGREVQRVLDALGYPEALVTDLSLVADFDLDGPELGQAALVLGVPAISNDDRIVDIAGRLLQRN